MTKKIMSLYFKLKATVYKKNKSDDIDNNTLNKEDKILDENMKSYGYFDEENIDKKYLDNYNCEISNMENTRILEKVKWFRSIDSVVEINESIHDNSFTNYLKKNSLYYKSNYNCPNCNKHVLYKIRAYNVDTIYDGKCKKLHHIFTCPNCRIFLGSIRTYNKLHSKWIGNKLSDYALISEKYSKLKYHQIINYTESMYSDDV